MGDARLDACHTVLLYHLSPPTCNVNGNLTRVRLTLESDLRCSARWPRNGYILSEQGIQLVRDIRFSIVLQGRMPYQKCKHDAKKPHSLQVRQKRV
jgi:hypothetical protein